jgi:hypothetical protein
MIRLFLFASKFNATNRQSPMNAREHEGKQTGWQTLSATPMNKNEIEQIEF